MTAMKRIFIILVLLVSNVLTSKAQSVGINSTGTAPTDTKAMLEVLKPGFSKIKIRTENNSADTSMLEFTNRKVSGAGTDFRMSMISQDGLFFTSASDMAANTNDSLMAIRVNGNIGMGIKNPAYKLHLHTPSSNNSFLSFTNNITGTTNQDGLVLGMLGTSARLGNLEAGELRFGTSNLTRALIDASGNMGIGTTVPAYKLDVAGDINMTGTLRLNGTTGTAGQVLTSNGIGAPSWSEAPLRNSDRFNVTFSEIISSTSGTLSLTTDYNFGGADIVIGANSITINKAGLYHFDLFLHYSALSATSPVVTFYLQNTAVTFLWQEVVVKKTSGDIYKDNWHYSFDLYVPAARILRLQSGFVDVTSFSQLQGNFSGHLISE